MSARDVTVSWAPDGRRFSILAPQGRPDATDLTIFEGQRVVAQYPDVGVAVWLDANRLLAYTRSTLPQYPDAATTAPARLIDPDSGTVTSVFAPVGDTLSSGTGALAAARLPESTTGIEKPQFVVLDGDGISETRAGYPVAWARDGSRLALLHPVSPTRGIEGWLEVIDWPSGSSVVADDHDNIISDARFSPSGRYIGYVLVVGEAPPFTRVIAVIDLDTAQRFEIEIGEHTDFQWNSSDEIEALTWDTAIDTYAATGEHLRSLPISQAAIIDAPPDGSVLLAYEGEEDDRTVAVIRAGVLQTIDLPAGTFGRVLIAPAGGQSLIAIMDTPDGNQTIEHVYVLDFG